MTLPQGDWLAYRTVNGRGPAVVWLSGFNSDMAGAKAQALGRWAQDGGRACVRFDYFGHGASSGRFAEGTVSRWRSDALTVVDELTRGPVILVGSSMGGWIATLVALARPERVAGLVLVAPAADMTGKLIVPTLPPSAQRALTEHGEWLRPSAYGAGDLISRRLLEDGERWSVLPGPIACHAPLRVLQGGADPDVPWRQALALCDAWSGPDVVFTLIGDGDHRLSRPADLTRLILAVEELAGA